MTTIPSLTFHDGKQAPQLGLGVWQIADESVDSVVATALELGYRSIDTAAAYDNETGVGRGIAQAGLPLDQTGVLPVLNQIELHPGFQQAALREFHAGHDIVTQAWSPLGQGRLWDEPVLKKLALKHGKSVAQIILRWHVQLGNMVIPKSVSASRLQENLAVFDFALDDSDMAAIAGLDRADGRIGPDPELFHLP